LLKKNKKTFMPAVIGIDEVGRGCLFGPVTAASFSFNPLNPVPEGLTDSKKLTPKKRKALATILMRDHHVVLASISSEEIDDINILQASLKAMEVSCLELMEKLGAEVEVRIDGIWTLKGLDPKIKQVPIVKGDLHDQAIGAASIVAKVYRDELMEKMETYYPGYDLSKHKGYPTKAHKEALKKLGVTDQHRRTFKGVSELL